MLREFAKIIGIDTQTEPTIEARREANVREEQIIADYLSEKIELPEFRSELDKLPRTNFIQVLVRLHSKA